MLGFIALRSHKHTRILRVGWARGQRRSHLQSFPKKNLIFAKPKDCDKQEEVIQFKISL